MRLSRRTMLSTLLATAAAGPVRAAAPIRIGVLKFGTVSWELDVIREHGFDTEAGISIAPVALATSQATQVALQARDVDMIVVDWLWVSRQRHAVSRSQHRRVQKKVDSINVIIGRLLKVQPVSPHLPLRLLLYDRPSAPLPSLSLGQFGAQRSNKKQRHPLTQKMSVRREIGR